MPSRLLLVLGNLVAITVTIAAFAQALSWTIAGILILVSLVLPLLANIAPRGVQFTPHTTSKSPNESSTTSINTRPQDKSAEKRSFSGNPDLPKTERKSLSKQQTVGPQQLGHESALPSIDKPRSLPAGANPGRLAPMVRSPDLNPTIGIDDYVEYELELEAGKDFLADVSADGLINVYLLDEENMDNLDEGEEFWSETGEESVENASLEFSAESKGRWFFVVENADDRAITVTVKIQKGSISTTQD